MIEEYEIPPSFLKRFILIDNSDEFILHINILSKEETRIIDFKTTINKARIISKKINDAYLTDPTINEYEINFQRTFLTKEQDLEEKIIYQIQQIQNSITSKIELKNEDKPLFNKLLYLLGNFDETENILDISSTKEAISFLSTQYRQKSIEYLSSHFKEFSESDDLDKIDESTIFDIIDLYFIKESRDDNDEIFENMKNNEKNKGIIMHFLLRMEEGYNESMIEYITKHIDDEIIDNERSLFVKMIYRALQKEDSLKNTLKKNEKTILCEFRDDDLDGIISYLWKTTDGDLLEKGVLKMKGGGRCRPGTLINVIKYDGENINKHYFNDYQTHPNENDGWIQFDFVERKINLTSYTLRTSSDNESYHAKSWRIVGSNDCIEWDVLDQQIDNSSMNGMYEKHRFECNKNNNYYQYIKFIQDDSFYPRCPHNIYMTCIELFGSITI